MADRIEWDMDANLPMYTRDFLADIAKEVEKEVVTSPELIEQVGAILRQTSGETTFKRLMEVLVAVHQNAYGLGLAMRQAPKEIDFNEVAVAPYDPEMPKLQIDRLPTSFIEPDYTSHHEFHVVAPGLCKNCLKEIKIAIFKGGDWCSETCREELKNG